MSSRFGNIDMLPGLNGARSQLRPQKVWPQTVAPAPNEKVQLFTSSNLCDDAPTKPYGQLGCNTPAGVNNYDVNRRRRAITPPSSASPTSVTVAGSGINWMLLNVMV